MLKLYAERECRAGGQDDGDIEPADMKLKR
jgi:hypothetical protein